MGIYRQKKSTVFWLSKTINGKQYYKSSGTSSKMEAKAIFESWVSDLKEQILTGKPIIKQAPINQISFSELSNKYLEFTSGRLKSHDRLKSFINTLNKYFSKKNLTDFTVLDIENMQSDIIRRELSTAYANRLTAILKRMFKKALEWELIDESVFKRISSVKLLRGEIKRLRYLTEEETERLINACNKEIRPIVITALNTGMRKSEIFNLTWDRVDLKNRIILLDKTKNGERREIPINDTLHKTLSGLVRRLDCKYVFYNPKTLKPFDNVKRSFSSALRKSHILDFHFHDLRHTFASRLVMAGVDLMTVKELLGHKDIKMTLRYSHLSQAHVRQAISVLDKKCDSCVTVGYNDRFANRANPY